jgi:hypothetical protein
MEKIREVFETEVFRLLLFIFMTLLSVWPFLADEKILSFRRVFLFLFVGWAVLIILLFLLSLVWGGWNKSGGE